MNLQTIRSEIQNRADDSSIGSTELDRWVNLGIKQWASRTDWPSLVEVDSSTTTTASTAEYSLPTDFKKMLSVRVSDAAGGTEVNSTEFSYVPYKLKNMSTAGNWYYLNPDDAKVGLIPTPATSGLTIYMKYYEIPADLTLTSDEPPFPESYHELCVFFALKKYWEKNDDFGKASYYDAEFENAIDQMKTDLLVRATGQLDRMKDVRELMGDDQPQQRNAINLGR